MEISPGCQSAVTNCEAEPAVPYLQLPRGQNEDQETGMVIESGTLEKSAKHRMPL